MKPGLGRLEKVPVCRAGSCENSSKKKLKSKAKEFHCGPGTSSTGDGLFSSSQARSFANRDDAGKLSSERLKKATRKSKVLQSALRVSWGSKGLDMVLSEKGFVMICFGSQGVHRVTADLPQRNPLLAELNWYHKGPPRKRKGSFSSCNCQLSYIAVC